MRQNVATGICSTTGKRTVGGMQKDSLGFLGGNACTVDFRMIV
jgi:hypothetical protein